MVWAEKLQISLETTIILCSTNSRVEFIYINDKMNPNRLSTVSLTVLKQMKLQAYKMPSVL